MEAEKPLGEAHWAGDFTLVIGYENSRRGWEVRSCWEHNPVLQASNDSVPSTGSIGIFVEGAPAPCRSYNQPAMVGPFIAQNREEILSEAVRDPVIASTWLLANSNIHLLHEGMVEKIQRTFIAGAASIVEL